MRKMELYDILKRVDHTMLSVSATRSDYVKLCDEGVAYNVASVCVPPSRIALCANQLGKQLAICTVVGFPNGYHDSETKVNEASLAIHHGASEIDMVIDIGKAKDRDYSAILEDIKKVRSVTTGFVLKVIIETSLLTDDEKIALCSVVNESGADFIKTSTGFSTGGATFNDVMLLRKYTIPSIKVKAAGGITSIEDAVRFIELGADRLGTSRIVKIAQAMESKNEY